jgi:hypothetical protein
MKTFDPLQNLNPQQKAVAGIATTTLGHPAQALARQKPWSPALPQHHGRTD